MGKSLFVVLCVACVACAEPFIVSCIGDSITEGYGTDDPRSWPNVLQVLLGTDVATVNNFGVSGTTMMKNGDYPYWSTSAYYKALLSNPDIVIIQLGTNDAKTYQWNAAEYTNDYTEMVKEFAALPSAPVVYANIPPPLYEDGVYSMNATVINYVLPDLIHDLAGDLAIELIDVFDHMGTVQLTHSSWFQDGCHPNQDGYQVLAETVYSEIRPW
ncbi:sialate O-acetylesterase [Pelomyxa schiedti]|nr:sialate O-acetylesterase [Pelomyxa schiedti]